jgi:hypothetical protein
MWDVRLQPSPTGLPRGSRQAPPRSPGSRAWSFWTCLGSTTTRDQPGTRANVPGHTAFRFDDSVGVPIAIFRSSIPSPSMPLFTLHRTSRDALCKTRGRVARYSFLVRLLHPLLHAGLSRRTVNYFFRSVCEPPGVRAEKTWRATSRILQIIYPQAPTEAPSVLKTTSVMSESRVGR